jgi:chromate transporter
MRQEKGVLWKLFTSMIYLGTFTFGGGYVIVTLMKKKFADELHWIDEKEMLDLIAIAQSAPGAIAVNGSIVVGYKLAGIPGVLVSILGTILPPFVILSIVSMFYVAFRDNIWVNSMLTGMQAGVGAVIIAVVLEMMYGIFAEKKWGSVAIMVIAFVLTAFLKINVVFVILGCIVFGGIRTGLKMRRGEV